MRKRAGIFIDGTNFYFIQKHFLGARVDIVKFVNYFRKFYDIYNAFFYLAYREEDEKQERFLRLLAFSGITVVKKPVKQLKDGSLKGDLDVEMAIDMLLTRDNYDVAVLCSGDSDFERLVYVLRQFGKEVLCVSTKESTSIELVNAADRYLDLKDILPEVKLETA
ncbi:MAG: NYN domain-containing protein [Aquificae bacterium]|nr:NYN domain-containing protein [Aquificota bacterium]